jgi:hypothetical protein
MQPLQRKADVKRSHTRLRCAENRYKPPNSRSNLDMQAPVGPQQYTACCTNSCIHLLSFSPPPTHHP